MASKTEAHEAPPAHVLAIPYMIQGHITPLLRFATQLARRGITVSFVCFEGSISPLKSSLGDSSSEEQIPNFRFVTIQQPAIREQSSEKILRELFEPIREELIRDKNAGTPGPTCIVSDMFLPWSVDVAEQLGIPRYMFITSGVIFARCIHGSLDYFDRGLFQISEKDGKLEEFDWPLCVPGLPPLRFFELDSVFRITPRFYLLMAESMMRSAGVVVNSFFELEEKVVESFQNPGDKHVKVPNIYPVGPLFSTTAPRSSRNVSGLEDSHTDCLGWLDARPFRSVVYVAFGSMVRLPLEQIKELAYGLEASNQHFLWVCPLEKIHSEQESPSSITEILPPGFQARVVDRGCIVTGWAPQLEILSHSSTGVFFSHCGWNSSLESILFGIPMIACPRKAEQRLNCRYLVDSLKVAEQVQTGKENIVNRNEVERAVRLMMESSEGRAMRSRAEELKRSAEAALGEGGSQSRYVQQFLDDMSSL